jgi:hypothetical protein
LEAAEQLEAAQQMQGLYLGSGDAAESADPGDLLARHPKTAQAPLPYFSPQQRLCYKVWREAHPIKHFLKKMIFPPIFLGNLGIFSPGRGLCSETYEVM